MVVADARPGGLHIPFRPGNTLSVELTWPTGDLTDRTFTSSLGGTALGVTIAGDTITIDATAAITAAVTTSAAWLLTETTDGASNDVLIGTWAPSDEPGTPTTQSLTVTVETVEVDVTVVSGQASIVALDGRVDTLEAARTVTVEWHTADDWDRFTEINVSEVVADDVVLTADDGIGTVTGNNADGNDRRIYRLDEMGTDIADAELHADVTLGKQVGLAFRVNDDVAVIVWTNVLFGANGRFLQGTWEFTGDNADLTLNQDAGSVKGFVSPVLSASGSGSAVTVQTKRPHELAVGSIVSFTSVGSFGQETVATVPDATSFTFTNSTSGSWTGGSYEWVIHGGRRKIAARLAGDRITWKQWLPTEVEPSWADPDRALSTLLPDTLDDSGGPPPATGGLGFLVAHLGADGTVGINDFVARVLD